MTLRYLLDTNVISEQVSTRPNELVVSKLQRHAEHCALAAVTWHELLYGSQRLPEGRKRRSLELYLHEVIAPHLPVLAYDDAAATWHARERARLDALGKPVPFIDGQIAAIAHAHDLTVVTRNTKDFTRFRDIQVVDWSTATRTRG